MARSSNFTNSKLVDYTRISPNKHSPRNKPLSKITIHHIAGDASVEVLGEIWSRTARQASSNYGVGTDGRVGLYVDESDRSWCSSSPDNDHQAITIEVANNSGAPNWTVSDKALNKTIELCVDICIRNNIDKINYTGNANGNLTLHKWFAATACPGPYLEAKMPWIAQQINKGIEAYKQAQKPTDTEAPEAPTTKPSETDKSTLYRVQTGAYTVQANAKAMLKRIQDAGYSSAFITYVAPYYKVQIGAFYVKANAENYAKQIQAKGFSTYIVEVKTNNKAETKPVETKPKKSNTEIAKEVIKGLWGNGLDRKNRLEAQGYDYVAVQKEVEKLLK